MGGGRVLGGGGTGRAAQELLRTAPELRAGAGLQVEILNRPLSCALFLRHTDTFAAVASAAALFQMRVSHPHVFASTSRRRQTVEQMVQSPELLEKAAERDLQVGL